MQNNYAVVTAITSSGYPNMKAIITKHKKERDGKKHSKYQIFWIWDFDASSQKQHVPYAIAAIKMDWPLMPFVDVFKAARDIAGMHDFTDKQIQNAVDLANA